LGVFLLGVGAAFQSLPVPVLFGAAVAGEKAFHSFWTNYIKPELDPVLEQKVESILGESILGVTPGISLEGYLSGSTVFADANGTGQLASNDASTTTDANGNFTLSGGSGPLYVFGGTDTSSGLPFKGQLSAPAGSTVITPLTTLLNDLSSDPSAGANILATLGLPAGLDLTTLDPIAAAESGSAAGAAVYVAGAKVYDTVSLIASALAGSSGGDFGHGAQDAFSALATALDGAGIDLSDETALTALINSIVNSENVTLTAGVADGVAAVIAASNAALDQKLQTDGAGAQLLSDVAAGEFVAQGAASDLLKQAAGNGTELPFVVNAFTGTNLTNAVAESLNMLSNGTAPTIIGVFASPGSGALNSGKAVSITLITSETVLVTGTPTLALNNCGTAVFDPANSTASSLRFNYTVGPSDADVSAVQVTAVNLPSGAIIQDAHNNNLNLSLTGLAESGPAIDTDTGEQAALKLTFVDALIGQAGTKTVHFSVGGIDPSDDTAVITFTDQSNNTATATVSANGTATADLSKLADGTVTAAVVVTDLAGNTFKAGSSNTATLDQDLGEQAALKLTVNPGTNPINAATAIKVPFTVSGLESDDSGTITFSDGNPADNVVVQIVNGVSQATSVNLSGMLDGTITSTLALNNDTAGNTFTPVSGNNVTLQQLDHWINSPGRNWATASDWKLGIPTGTMDADVDASGTYRVSITNSQTAYALLLNDAEATVSDQQGGSLSLVGTGGTTSPNGQLNITAGMFTLASGSLQAGSISIGSGRTFLISQGAYTGSNSITPSIADNGSFTVANSASANITGGITGTGSFAASGSAQLIVNGPDTGTGSFTIANTASLEIGAADSENIIFAPSSNALLKLDYVSLFTGAIGGLNTNDKINLAGLPWVQGHMTAVYSGTTAGGTLTISNGAQTDQIKMLGNFLSSS
jgi:hypothetical protein